MLTWANPISLRADTCDTLDCGDANGDGFINISDVAQASYYLSHPNLVPTNCADGDGYDLVTHRDLFRVLRYIVASAEPPLCVSRPKLIPVPNSDLSITFDQVIHEDVGFATLKLRLSNRLPLQLISFSMPFTIRVNGELPLSLSIDREASTLPSTPGFFIDASTGSALVRYVDTPIDSGEYIICDIIVRVEPSPIVRHVTLEYTELGPYMTGVFEPPNSACNYVMFLDDSLNAWQPELVPTCMCGDADNNGFWTISDAVYIVYHIFGNTNPLAQPCLGDANGSGGVSISDAIYLIVYILGGPPPRCP